MLATLSTLVTLIGYVVQFIGIRALHWSATVASLGFTLIMSGVRLSIRRGISSQSSCIPIPANNELPWIAMYISHQLLAARARGRLPIEWSQLDVMNYSGPLPSGRFPFPHTFCPHFELVTGGFNCFQDSQSNSGLGIFYPLSLTAGLQKATEMSLYHSHNGSPCRFDERL